MSISLWTGVTVFYTYIVNHSNNTIINIMRTIINNSNTNNTINNNNNYYYYTFALATKHTYSEY